MSKEGQKKEQIGIKSLPEDDRPREKLLLRGRESLTNAELMAILIGSGNKNMSAVQLSQKILTEAAGNRLPDLARLNVSELMRFNGIGEAKAISIVAALELGARRRTEEVVRTKILTSRDIFSLMSGRLSDLSHEEFWVVLLNRANMVLGTKMIGKGGVSGTVADPKLVFKEALDAKASSVVVVHNHPSGNLQPSQADKTLTEKLKQGGIFLEIQVVDHIIVADNRYFSFADEGIL